MRKKRNDLRTSLSPVDYHSQLQLLSLQANDAFAQKASFRWTFPIFTERHFVAYVHAHIRLQTASDPEGYLCHRRWRRYSIGHWFNHFLLVICISVFIPHRCRDITTFTAYTSLSIMGGSRIWKGAGPSESLGDGAKPGRRTGASKLTPEVFCRLKRYFLSTWYYSWPFNTVVGTRGWGFGWTQRPPRIRHC